MLKIIREIWYNIDLWTHCQPKRLQRHCRDNGYDNLLRITDIYKGIKLIDKDFKCITE